jgi:hypothetical protein
MSQVAAITPALPLLKRSSRGMHRRICAAPGAGKTRITARLLMLWDAMIELPLIAIDPIGALSDDFLDAVDRLPPDIRRGVSERITYVNVAGQEVETDSGHETYVHPFPILYRADGESLYSVAYRYLSVIERAFPALQSAGILGMPAVASIGENVIMALVAMGCGITEARDLLLNTERWEGRLRSAREAEPEAAPAIDYLLGEYKAMKPEERRRETLSFLRRISMFHLDPVLRAQYGAAAPSFTLKQVVDERRCVLFDFRNVLNLEQRRLGILWLYQYCNTYFRARGPQGKHQPLAFYIDELGYLLPSGKERDKLIAGDLSDLFSLYGRNNGVWVTVIHQDLQQFDEATNVLLSRLGGQLLGASADVKGAREIAERFFRFNKHQIKGLEPVYTTIEGVVHHIDDRKVYQSPQEQNIEHGYRFLDLEQFHFLLGVARREGQLPTHLDHVSFAAFDRGKFARGTVVDELRTLLMIRDGQRVSSIHEELAARLSGGDDRVRVAHAASPPDDQPPPSRRRWDTEDEI